MHSTALAWVCRDAQGRGALQNVNEDDLSAIKHTKIDRLGMASHQVLHHGFCDRLQLPEIHCDASQREELRSQPIASRTLGLFYVAQFLQGIENAMYGRSRVGKILGELGERYRILAPPPVDGIFEHGKNL